MKTTMMAAVVMMTMMTTMTMVGQVGGAFNEPDWGFQSYLNDNFTLECDHSTLRVEPHNHVEWSLPSGHHPDTSGGRYRLTDGLRGSVTNMHLHVMHVQDSDAGVYVCVVYNNIRKEVRRGQLVRGLNLGGPKYRESFEEYRENLVVGGIAALALFVPLVTLCFVYKFRYQTEEQKRAKLEARSDLTKHQRYLEGTGKGAQLSDVAVTVEQGESNSAYDMNTHL